MSLDVAHGFVPEWTMGDRIRKARRESGVSQRDLHAALVLAGIDVTPQALGNWESGANDVSEKLRSQVAAVVALKTRVNRNWLLTGSTRRGPDGGESADYASVQVIKPGLVLLAEAQDHGECGEGWAA